MRVFLDPCDTLPQVTSPFCRGKATSPNQSSKAEEKDVVFIAHYLPFTAPGREEHNGAPQTRAALYVEQIPSSVLSAEARGMASPGHAEGVQQSMGSSNHDAPEEVSQWLEEADKASGWGSPRPQDHYEELEPSRLFDSEWTFDRSSPISSCGESEEERKSPSPYDGSSPIVSVDEPVNSDGGDASRSQAEDDSQSRDANSLRDDFYVQTDDEGAEELEILAENVFTEDIRLAGLAEFMASCIPEPPGILAPEVMPRAHLTALKMGDTVQLRAAMSVADWKNARDNVCCGLEEVSAS